MLFGLFCLMNKEMEFIGIGLFHDRFRTEILSGDKYLVNKQISQWCNFF